MSKTDQSSPAKKSRPGVYAFMSQLILGGEDDTKEILKRVHHKFRDSRATSTDVGIIRRKCAPAKKRR